MPLVTESEHVSLGQHEKWLEGGTSDGLISKGDERHFLYGKGNQRGFLSYIQPFLRRHVKEKQFTCEYLMMKESYLSKS
jgi:hypothetical protein